MPTAPSQVKPRKTRTPVDPNETPRERFIRLAQLRVGNTLKSLDTTMSLSNHTTYEYTDDDVDKIESALRTKLDQTIRALRTGKPAASAAFTL